MNPITQKDIADALKLNRVTVTKALQHHPDISKQTVKRVEKMAKKMGYTPNLVARQLSTRRTLTIGFVVPKIANSFFGSAIESACQTALEKGYRIVPMVSFENPDIEIKNIETLVSMRVDGIIINITEKTKNIKQFITVRNKGIPIIFFDRVLKGDLFPIIVVDDYNAAFNAVEHAIGQGYRQIAHFGGHRHLLISTDRYRGYRDALQKHAIPLTPEWICHGGLQRHFGYQSFMKLYDHHNLPEIIFTVSDFIAQGIYQAAKEKGLNIPNDVGVIGFGDFESSQLLTPPLTSVHEPIQDMAARAVHLLIDKIEYPEKAIPQKTVFPAQLVIRDSCKKREDH